MSTRNSTTAVVGGFLLSLLSLCPVASPAASRQVQDKPQETDQLKQIRELNAAGRYAIAEQAARTAWEQIKAGPGADSLVEAQICDLLAEALNGQILSKQAAEVAERAVALKERLLEPGDPEQAASLYHLGTALRRTRRFEEARRLLERAVAIQDKTLGPGDPATVRTLRAMGILELEDAAGNKERARSLLDRAVAIGEKALGSSHPEYGLALHDQARILKNTGGDYLTVLSTFQRALAVLEESLGPHHPEVGRLCLNMSAFLISSGEPALALPVVERAVQIDEEVFGAESFHVAIDLVNLASTYAELGELERARSTIQRAVAILRPTTGSARIMSLALLTDIEADLGNFTQALELAREVNGLIAERYPPGHELVADGQGTLGNVLDLTGDYEGAVRAYRTAADVRSNLSDSTRESFHLMKLGKTLMKVGRFEEADVALSRSLEIHEKNLPPEGMSAGEVLAALTELAFRTHDSERVISTGLRFERFRNQNLRLATGYLSEREMLHFSAHYPEVLSFVLSLGPELQRHPVWIAGAWDSLVRSRALVLDETASRNLLLTQKRDPHAAALVRDFADSRTRLARLLVRGLEGESGYEEIQKARLEMETAEREVAGQSSLFRNLAGLTKVGPSDIREALPARSALVSFVRFQQHGRLESGNHEGPPQWSYEAFCLNGRKKEPSAVFLGSAGPVDALVERLRGQIAQEARSGGRATRRSEAGYREAALALRKKVWDPLLPCLGEAQRVFIVPDGALNLVNFAALPVGQTKYLIETGPRIHYLSAERDLVPLPGESEEGQGILALGAPAFDEKSLFASLTPEEEKRARAEGVGETTFRGLRSACQDFQAMRFEALPGSSREVDAVAALWKQSSSPLRGAGRDALQLTGESANEATFKHEAPGKQVLHLATHGFFLGGNCRSALESAGTDKLGPFPAVQGESPLVLAGLALAGANHRQAAGPDEEDGILTAEEVGALNLSGVEWAVLSACDTGVGEVKVGEGVLGLRRAFKVAGARTLIMSLWPVDDQSVREWMTELYSRRLREGRSTIDSVHLASLKILRNRRARKLSTHPFYWAAFVAAGDWR